MPSETTVCFAVGYALISFYRVPEAWRVWRRRSARDFSAWSLILGAVALGCLQVAFMARGPLEAQVGNGLALAGHIFLCVGWARARWSRER